MVLSNVPPIVLIVDDEALLRLNATDTLLRAGCRTYEAADTEEALAVLARHPEISVLFTDVNMPGARDGIALAGEVHRRWPSPEDMPPETQFFSKPYDLDVIARLVCDGPVK